MNFSDDPVKADFASLQQAAEWFAVLRSEATTVHERHQWQQWLDSRRENRAAWQRVEMISQRYDLLSAPNARNAAHNALKEPLRSSRRRVLKTLCAVVATGTALGMGARHSTWVAGSWATLRADLRTATGETREVVLQDAGRLWLNTGSAVDFDARERRLTVHSGEILLDVGRRSRPITIETAQGRFHFDSARIAVRQLENETFAAVFAGHVEFQAGDNVRRQLLAGQQLQFSREALGSVQPAARARQAWSNGVLLADDIPLREFIDELARYHRGHLHCTPEIGNLRVVGAYPLHEPERILAMLETALPIRIRRIMPWWTTVEPRIV